MNAGGNFGSATRTLADAEALLSDLIESSESQMHREIAKLQQATLSALHNQLKEACSGVYLRALQLGLNAVEAQDVANSLRSQQYTVMRMQMRERILAIKAEHTERAGAIRAWHRGLVEQIQTRAAEAARGNPTVSE